MNLLKFHQSQLFERYGNPYSQSYLQPKNDDPQKFLNDVSFSVKTDLLYNFSQTCQKNKDFTFCPVLLEISNKELKKEKGGDFLLQVWESRGDTQRVIYEKVLKNKVQKWAQSQNHLIFRPSAQDANSEYLHILNCERASEASFTKREPESLELLVQDWTSRDFEFLLFGNDQLIQANQNRIEVLLCPEKEGENWVQKVENPKTEDIHVYSSSLKIWSLEPTNRTSEKGIFLLAVELQDAQLSVNRMRFSTSQNQFKLDEENDYCSWSYEKTKITKVKCFKTSAQKQPIFLVQRDDHMLDIYIEFERVFTIEDQVKKFNFDMEYLYIQLETLEAELAEKYKKLSTQNSLRQLFKRSGRTYRLNMSDQHNIALNSDSLVDESFSWEMVNSQKVESYVNLFESFILVQNTLYVQHGAYISQYSLQSNMWMSHTKFEDRILKVFRSRSRQNQLSSDTNVILENGKIYQNLPLHDEPQVEVIQNQLYPEAELDIQGTRIHKVIQDKEIGLFTMILLENKEVYVFFSRGLSKLQVGREGIEQFEDLSKDSLCLCHQEEHGIYFLQQIGLKIHFFELFLSTDKSRALVKKEGEYMIDCLKKQDKKVEKHLTELNSACVTKNGNFIIFSNTQGIFAIPRDSQKHPIRVTEEQVTGFFISEGQYMYTLKKDPKLDTRGLFLYEIEEKMFKKMQLPKGFILTQPRIGCQGWIDYSRKNHRITYRKDFKTIEIVPLLHRNTIQFMGMPEREQIVVTRQQEDLFTVLTMKNKIITWDITTGKLIHQQDVSDQIEVDLSQYEVFRGLEFEHTYYAQQYDKTLLKKIEPVPEESLEFNKKLQEIKENARNHAGTLVGQKSFQETRKLSAFNFILVKISKSKEHEVQVLRDFDFQIEVADTNRLDFNEDNSLMLHQVRNGKVVIYSWVPTPESDQKGIWCPFKKLVQFPFQLQGKHHFNCLFSPNFSLYLDYDFSSKRFKLMDTYKQTPAMFVPEKFIYAKAKKMSELVSTVARFKWESQNSFKYVTEEGIERLVSFDCTKEEGQQFEQVSYNYVPYFNQEEFHHYYYAKKEVAQTDVKTRLIRKYQDYKQSFHIHKLQDRRAMLQKLITVDIGYHGSGYEKKLVASFPFTFFDWKLIDELSKGNLEIGICMDNIHSLCLNILPNGETLVHKICMDDDLVKAVFSYSQPNEEDRAHINFEIPFLKSLVTDPNTTEEGVSPLHLVVQRDDSKTTNMLLDYLSGYRLDHHSREINDILPQIIRTQLPNVGIYFESRIKQTEETRRINEGFLLRGELGLAASKLTIDQEQITSQFFQQDAKLVNDIKTEVLDIPKAHQYSETLSQEFFEALAESEQFELFAFKSVQSLINFKYGLVKRATIIKLFLPYIVFLTTFVIYIDIVVVQHRVSAKTEYYTLMILNQLLILSFSLYFLVNELRQLWFQTPAKYFMEFWNYIDLIPPVLAFGLVASFWISNSKQIAHESSNPNEIGELEAVFNSLATFFMWFKLLYFFRIFSEFAYLIRMIVQVIFDMKHFLTVLFITIIAFGDSFYSLSLANKEKEDQFVSGFWDSILYTYNMCLGDYDTDQIGKVAPLMVLFFFFACTLFNMIVMFNLLIAIISETFNDVNSNAEQAGMQEKAALIAENSYLVSKSELEGEGQDSFLLIATDTDQEIVKRDQAQVRAIQRIAKEQKELKHLIQDRSCKTEQTLAEIVQEIKKIKAQALGASEIDRLNSAGTEGLAASLMIEQ